MKTAAIIIAALVPVAILMVLLAEAAYALASFVAGCCQ